MSVEPAMLARVVALVGALTEFFATVAICVALLSSIYLLVVTIFLLFVCRSEFVLQPSAEGCVLYLHIVECTSDYVRFFFVSHPP